MNTYLLVIVKIEPGTCVGSNISENSEFLTFIYKSILCIYGNT